MNEQSLIHRTKTIRELISELEPDEDVLSKNSPRELLKYGFIHPQIQTVYHAKMKAANFDDDNKQSVPFSILARYSNWFALHPHKVAGKQEPTTSLFFPIKIDATKDDVIKMIDKTIFDNKQDTGEDIEILELEAEAMLLLGKGGFDGITSRYFINSKKTNSLGALLSNEQINKNLRKIAEKYQNIKFNEDNFEVGGGLDEGVYASRRHEDAKYDKGKLTLGKATQMFKKATDLDTDTITEVIKYAVPLMEWHHAGRLPKSYGGGMKKTYFLKSTEIVDIATNFNKYFEIYQNKVEAKKSALQLKNELAGKREKFLQANAKRIIRTAHKPKYFYQTSQEMNGKYGWFDSTYKSYNMTEYYSGWEFETEEKYNEFLNIK